MFVYVCVHACESALTVFIRGIAHTHTQSWKALKEYHCEPWHNTLSASLIYKPYWIHSGRKGDTSALRTSPLCECEPKTGLSRRLDAMKI